MKRRTQKGFSLIELLVVVSIILLISAIALPKLIQARIAANESATVGNLRAVLNAQMIYQSRYGGVSTTLASLTTTATPNTCTASGVLDPTQFSGATPILSGYTLTFTSPLGTDVPQLVGGCTVANSFSMVATPNSSYTGVRGFYVDQSGTIHYTPDGSAPTSTSSALGQ
jgi:type IV pilus assembly protein PilA